MTLSKTAQRRNHREPHAPTRIQALQGRRIPPTTRVERSLLMITILLLPTAYELPAIAGFSFMWIVFAVLGAYVVINRGKSLAKVWRHPLFLSAYLFLGVATLVELVHPHSSFEVILMTAQMVGGAVLIACLCRDRAAMAAAMYGFIGLSIWLCVLLFSTSYGVLSGADATNFNQATNIRGQAMEASLLQGNANTIASTVGQGAIVALAFVLSARRSIQRYLFLALGAFCLVGSFLPMSRSGLALVAISCAAVMFSSGVRITRMVLIGGLIVTCLLVFVPGVVWTRMTFSTEREEGRVEARAGTYLAVVNHLPDYIWTGVGEGNFWTSWGRQSEFVLQGPGLVGAHNCFAQAAIYWGLGGLLGILFVVWRGFRSLPKRYASDPLALSILGLSISLLSAMMFHHNFYAKEIALGLGILAGGDQWVWPKALRMPQVAGFVPRVRQHS